MTFSNSASDQAYDKHTQDIKALHYGLGLFDVVHTNCETKAFMFNPFPAQIEVKGQTPSVELLVFFRPFFSWGKLKGLEQKPFWGQLLSEESDAEHYS